LKLITSNEKKYIGLGYLLDRLRIDLIICNDELIEKQSENFIDGIRFKALQAEKRYGEPILVDDSGLLINKYEYFPGTITKTVLKQLGVSGLEELVGNNTTPAKMVSILGIAIEGNVYYWQGIVKGNLDFGATINNHKMPLLDIFIPDNNSTSKVPHRIQAFKELQKDALKIHLKLDYLKGEKNELLCSNVKDDYCPFCIEINDIEQSIFRKIAEDKIKNRIIYEDDHFLIMVPLGEFIEGGLLLLSKKHIPSFAYLDKALYSKLTNLINKVIQIMNDLYNIPPLIFEHGPALDKFKGQCCVDHAHLNIFPVAVDLHPHLKNRMYCRLSDIKELSKFKSSSEGYLYVANSKMKHIYDGFDAPSQLIRKIITKEIGMESRWHWRNYLGLDEMIKTINDFSNRL